MDFTIVGGVPNPLFKIELTGSRWIRFCTGQPIDVDEDAAA